MPMRAAPRISSVRMRLAVDATLRARPGELGDHLLVERRQVVRLAAGDEALVHDDLLIDPSRAGVAQIGLERRPRGHRSPADAARFDERPWSMADGCDGLALVEEVPHEPHRLGDLPEL